MAKTFATVAIVTASDLTTKADYLASKGQSSADTTEGYIVTRTAGTIHFVDKVTFDKHYLRVFKDDAGNLSADKTAEAFVGTPTVKTTIKVAGVSYDVDVAIPAEAKAGIVKDVADKLGFVLAVGTDGFPCNEA
jgi:hypothetical protein